MDIRTANRTINLVNAKRKANIKRLQIVKPVEKQVVQKEVKKSFWQKVKSLFSWSK